MLNMLDVLNVMDFVLILNHGRGKKEEPSVVFGQTGAVEIFTARSAGSVAREQGADEAPRFSVIVGSEQDDVMQRPARAGLERGEAEIEHPVMCKRAGLGVGERAVKRVVQRVQIDARPVMRG